MFDAGLPLALALAALLGCALMAGLFFAFSVCVMRALGRLPAASAIAVMQTINAVILNPVFGLVFAGTAFACVVLAILGALAPDAPGALAVLAGSALYVLGGVGVTFAFNVPRNTRLAAADPDAADSAALWADYLVTWTAWNHVRTLACLAATALIALGL